MYGRQVEERTLDFGHSGRLYKNGFVLYDFQTQSLWTHVTGEAIYGELKGKKLQRATGILVTPRISFSDWRKQFPHTKVLSVNGRSERQNDFTEYLKKPNWWAGMTPPIKDQRVSLKTLIIGIVATSGPRAYPRELFEKRQILIDKALQPPVIIFYDVSSGAAAAYRTELDGRSLEFGSEVRNFTIHDSTTNSTWHLLKGKAIAGELKGTALTPEPLIEMFWGAWADYHPKTYLHGH